MVSAKIHMVDCLNACNLFALLLQYKSRYKQFQLSNS